MQQRDTLAHLILAIVVILSLTPLMVAVDAQAQIAFSSNREGDYEIYVMGINGKNERRLTNNLHADWHPSWSPDGKRIVFSSKRDGGFTSEIYVMDADGSNPQRLTNNGHDDYSPSWSPDGKRIVFASVGEIHVIDTDGQNEQNLSQDNRKDNSPSWSPDAKRIAFSSERDGHFRNDFGITADIYVMDADGGNQRRLTKHGSPDRSPSWSPDGERIAFSSFRDGDWEIYVMDADGGNQRNLTKHGSWDLSPAWYTPALAVSPTGKTFTMWGWLKQVDR